MGINPKTIDIMSQLMDGKVTESDLISVVRAYQRMKLDDLKDKNLSTKQDEIQTQRVIELLDLAERKIRLNQ